MSDRCQTDVRRQTKHRLMPRLLGAGHNKRLRRRLYEYMELSISPNASIEAAAFPTDCDSVSKIRRRFCWLISCTLATCFYQLQTLNFCRHVIVLRVLLHLSIYVVFNVPVSLQMSRFTYLFSFHTQYWLKCYCHFFISICSVILVCHSSNCSGNLQC